jgi:hypothetical protein
MIDNDPIQEVNSDNSSDEPGKDEVWIKTLGLIQIFAGVSSDSGDNETEINLTSSCEEAGNQLATIDISAMEEDLCLMLIKASVNYLICAENEYICIISARLLVNFLNSSRQRMLAEECGDLLDILFSEPQLLMSPAYLFWSFEVVLCIITSHPRPKRALINGSCSVCGVHDSKCLALPFMSEERREVVCLLGGIVSTVLTHCLDVTLLCKTWALCSELLRK